LLSDSRARVTLQRAKMYQINKLKNSFERTDENKLNKVFFHTYQWVTSERFFDLYAIFPISYAILMETSLSKLSGMM
jgi:hypothetical protein